MSCKRPGDSHLGSSGAVEAIVKRSERTVARRTETVKAITGAVEEQLSTRTNDREEKEKTPTGFICTITRQVPFNKGSPATATGTGTWQFNRRMASAPLCACSASFWLKAWTEILGIEA